MLVHQQDYFWVSILFKTQAIIFIPVIVVFKRLSDATLLNTPKYTQKSCLHYSMCIRSINPCSSELLECKHEVLFAPIHNLQKKLSHLSVLLLFWGHKSTLTTVLHPSFILSGTEIYSLTSTEVLSHFNIPYLLGNSKERGIKFSSRKV